VPAICRANPEPSDAVKAILKPHLQILLSVPGHDREGHNTKVRIEDL
jgi:hypothetical protein